MNKNSLHLTSSSSNGIRINAQEFASDESAGFRAEDGDTVPSLAREPFIPGCSHDCSGSTSRMAVLARQVVKGQKRQVNEAHHEQQFTKSKGKKAASPVTAEQNEQLRMTSSDLLFVQHTNLIWASSSGNLQVVEKMLEEGVNPYGALDLGVSMDTTALHAAAQHNHLEVLEVLLAHEKANVNIKDALGLLPSTYAVQNNHLEAINLLLAHGADPNGKYSLLLAIENDNIEVLETLLKYNADPNHSSQMVKTEDKDILPVFFNKEKYSFLDGFSPLMMAIFNGSLKMAEMLLDYEALIDVVDAENISIFDHIVMRRSSKSDDFTYLLCRKGWNINSVNKSGHTTLGNAAYYGVCEMTTALLACGADPDVGHSPLRRAASIGVEPSSSPPLITGVRSWVKDNCLDNVRQLLIYGANLNSLLDDELQEKICQKIGISVKVPLSLESHALRSIYRIMRSVGFEKIDQLPILGHLKIILKDYKKPEYFKY